MYSLTLKIIHSKQKNDLHFTSRFVFAFVVLYFYVSLSLYTSLYRVLQILSLDNCKKKIKNNIFYNSFAICMAIFMPSWALEIMPPA